jgi:23S rRNA pseudouridine1911/1915/1917 synthase
MVVAKSDAVHLGLCWQFAHRQVEKYYHVVVCGTLANEEGSIEAAIARHPNHRKCMAVSAGGRPALTGYRVLERLREATLLEARLHTGRTHQVRVHFKHLGHAVVGDLIYGKRANARLEEATGCRAPRQMLHAQTLAFTHPVTGERLRFTAPWPADFAAVVEQLRLQETLRPGRDTPR